jgi:hypothetical protein
MSFEKAAAARNPVEKGFGPFDLCTYVPNQNHISSKGRSQASIVTVVLAR